MVPKSQPTQSEVLDSLSEQFAHSNAEAEAGTLPAYFVETRAWKDLLRGKVDIVKGAKGTGKSALHALLLRHQQELRETRNTLILPAERPSGETTFQGALLQQRTTDGAMSAEDFRQLWHRYFLALSVAALREEESSSPPVAAQLQALPEYRALVAEMIRNNLLPKQGDSFEIADILGRVIKSIRSRVKLGVGITVPPIVIVAEDADLKPSGDEKPLMQGDHTPPRDLFGVVNNLLAAVDLSLWIALDRLDDAFQNLLAELEPVALRTLLQTYNDLTAPNYVRIKPKLFVRDDIFSRALVGAQPFRVMDKIEAVADLKWTSGALLDLVMRRVLRSPLLAQRFALSDSDVDLALDDYEKQEILFYRLFPESVDGQATWIWLQAQLMDGHRQVAPRDLIKFMRHAIEIQVDSHRRADNGKLFDEPSLLQASAQTSRDHYQTAFQAEYPELREYTDILKEQRRVITGYTIGALRRIWRRNPANRNMPEKKAEDKANELVEVGFFSKVSVSGWLYYRMAPLYRRDFGAVEEDSTPN